MVELKQFVKEALLGIIDGVDVANSQHNRFKIIGMRRTEDGIDGSDVYFDVSVVAEQKSGGKVGGNIGVSVLKVVSADVGSELEQTNYNQSVSRLKFKVWVSENELR